MNSASDAVWRPMLPTDLPAVFDLADRIHPDYPEDHSVLAEKLRLFPEGCLTLENGGTVIGYCYSHPWIQGIVPKLNAPLRVLPPDPTTFFIHDVAVHADWRRQGLAPAVIPILRDVSQAMRLLRMSLVAVHQTQDFWKRLGFAETTDAALQRAVRAAYSEEARHMEMQITEP